jgi:hypothetical protein
MRERRHLAVDIARRHRRAVETIDSADAAHAMLWTFLDSQ